MVARTRLNVNEIWQYEMTLHVFLQYIIVVWLISKWWAGKDFEVTDRSLIEVIPLQMPAQTVKDHETPVRLACVQAEIQPGTNSVAAMSGGSDWAFLNCHIGKYLHKNKTEKIRNLLTSKIFVLKQRKSSMASRVRQGLSQFTAALSKATDIHTRLTGRANMQDCIRTYLPTYIHTQIHTYIYACVHTYAYTHAYLPT
jgi:hypothetical protein